MAKRTEEKPFRPLEASLVHEVMHGTAAVAVEAPPVLPKTIELRQPPPEAAPFRAEPVYMTPPRPQPKPARTRPVEAPLVERMEREKRVLLTPSEERALERVVANIGAELGTSLKLSHVLRSAIRLVIAAEDELIQRARDNGRTIRPPNGDLAAIEAFEKVIATVLQGGIRSARPIR
jgi:hypothetical protein